MTATCRPAGASLPRRRTRCPARQPLPGRAARPGPGRRRAPAGSGRRGREGREGVRWKREQALPNCPTLDLKKKVAFRRGPARRRKSCVSYSCCLYSRNRIARKGKVPLTKPAGTKIRLNAPGHRAAERSPLRSGRSGTEPTAGPKGAFSCGSLACFPSRSLCLQNSATATFPCHQ